MKAYVLLATGFEEIEALTPVDILRRAGITVVMVSTTDKLSVKGSHEISVIADTLLADIAPELEDLVILPGGKPGTQNLENNDKVIEIVKRQYERGSLVAAICAAPSILGHLGILEGKRACCYPGYEQHLTGAIITDQKAVVDKTVITGAGMGASVDFALKLVEVLQGSKAAEVLKVKIVY